MFTLSPATCSLKNWMAEAQHIIVRDFAELLLTKWLIVSQQ